MKRRNRWAAFIAIAAIAQLGCSKDGGGYLSDVTGFDGSPSWSPDGGRIAYAHIVPLDRRDDSYPTGIYVLDLTTGQRTRVRGGSALGTDWSPDGRRLAFGGDHGVGYIDLETGAERMLTSVSAIDPSWSPDGTTIAFESGDALWLADTAGTAPHSLTSDYAKDPDWSPDGRRLAALMRLDPGVFSQLTMIDRDGALVRRLTTNRTGDFAPSWSPLGGRIAWIRMSQDARNSADAELCVTDTAGAHVEVVHRDGVIGSGQVAWSPDGAMLLFVGSERRGTRIFAIDADGSDLRRISE